MSEHGAMAITYGATEAQSHRERTERGDDSTRRREAAHTDREDENANQTRSPARFVFPSSRSVPGPAPQARPRRILCVSVPCMLILLLDWSPVAQFTRGRSGKSVGGLFGA
jgi:hypothetical protein